MYLLVWSLPLTSRFHRHSNQWPCTHPCRILGYYQSMVFWLSTHKCIRKLQENVSIQYLLRKTIRSIVVTNVQLPFCYQTASYIFLCWSYSRINLFLFQSKFKVTLRSYTMDGPSGYDNLVIRSQTISGWTRDNQIFNASFPDMCQYT